jgi:hypothetical protein
MDVLATMDIPIHDPLIVLSSIPTSLSWNIYEYSRIPHRYTTDYVFSVSNVTYIDRGSTCRVCSCSKASTFTEPEH